MKLQRASRGSYKKMKKKLIYSIIMLIGIFFVLVMIFNKKYINNDSSKNHYWNQWALNNDGTFEYSHLDEEYIYTTSYNSVEGIDINYNNGIALFNSKRSVTIAVIDSGVQYNHIALNDSIWKNYKEVAGDGIDNDNNGYVDDVYGWNFYNNNNDISQGINGTDHGTHIVGTLCAYGEDSAVRGVLGGYNFEIMCLKILDENANGDVNALKEAIRYAENNGAEICCLSIDTAYDSELESLIQQSDMIFVVSAGNNGIDIDNNPIYPASYKSNNIVVVANVSSDGQLNDTSNYGLNTVDIAAPGTDIISTVPDNTYNYKTGTSMSVPFVAGVIALTYSNNESLNLITAKNVVLQSAKKNDNLKNKIATGGIVDLYNSLSY